MRDVVFNVQLFAYLRSAPLSRLYIVKLIVLEAVPALSCFGQKSQHTRIFYGSQKPNVLEFVPK